MAMRRRALRREIRIGKWTTVVTPMSRLEILRSGGFPEAGPLAYRGYFEHADHGEGGGLWFNPRKELIDYDGAYDLPMEVIDGIIELGYWFDADNILPYIRVTGQLTVEAAKRGQRGALAY